MIYIVICREDTAEDGTPGTYALATRQTFADRGDAEAYARTIAVGRAPLVVEGRFAELRCSEAEQQQLDARRPGRRAEP